MLNLSIRLWKFRDFHRMEQTPCLHRPSCRPITLVQDCRRSAIWARELPLDPQPTRDKGCGVITTQHVQTRIPGPVCPSRILAIVFQQAGKQGMQPMAAPKTARIDTLGINKQVQAHRPHQTNHLQNTTMRLRPSFPGFWVSVFAGSWDSAENPADPVLPISFL